MRLRWMLNAVDQPWGDYGTMLAYGMTDHLGRDDAGRVRLEHAGPFVPPFFLSGVVLLNDSVKARLEQSGLNGFILRPVELVRIVDLDWRSWDLDATDPREYPDSGEPEDYLLTRPHDPSMAALVGPVWELAARPWREAQEADFAQALPERRSTLVSDAAADWISERFSEWVRLLPWSPSVSVAEVGGS